LFGAGFLHAVFAQIRQTEGHRLLDHFDGTSFGDTDESDGSRIAAAARARRLDARTHSVKPASELMEGKTCCANVLKHLLIFR
jgi:hypothetical protein